MKPERQPPLAIRGIEVQSNCDQCGKHRAHGNHSACSKKRQAMHAGKWEAHKKAIEESGANKGRSNRGSTIARGKV